MNKQYPLYFTKGKTELREVKQPAQGQRWDLHPEPSHSTFWLVFQVLPQTFPPPNTSLVFTEVMVHDNSQKQEF